MFITEVSEIRNYCEHSKYNECEFERVLSSQQERVERT